MDEVSRDNGNGDLEIRFRDCFSVRYIQSAALLCRLGYEIECSARKTGEVFPEDLLRHEAFILNSVLSSVAFLECTINELHADAADGAYNFTDEKQEILLREISERWKNEKNFDRAPIIEKYQRILEITGKAPFGEQEQAFVHIRLLTEIRNHLLHYKREWVVIQVAAAPGPKGGCTADRFEKILRTKFAPNPLAAKNQPFFPDKCLGHGCAEWAVLNSLIFTDAFFRRLGLPAPYEGIREDLATR